tara:strand:+ start:228 stop:1157 length:930 start_codon:yes stop_codon:yes gene_type:complete
MKINKPKFWDKKNLTFFSILLLPLSFIYIFLMYIRKFFKKEKKFSIPIICVGNIYIGGTGKTPICIKLKNLLDVKRVPIVIKKKYKDQKDEIELLKKYTKLIVCDERSKGIESAIEKKFDTVILDDGFQDTSIEKNLNIICFNYNQQIGNGQVLPAGPLRETLSSLKMANIILVNGEKDTEFELKLKKYNNDLKFFYFTYNLKKFDEFKNRKLIAFAGIGNSINFFNSLKENRLNVIKEITFPDHHDYSDNDLEKLIELENQNKAKLITTEKDYLRISPLKRRRFGFVSINVNIKNENDLIDEVNKILK